ncbi:16S rRNA (guanine(527)-N(7))-methyltransferase RsmG [Parendozoicomonas sp. Alg238-R29]|uniref:16S rRNA (guanine(527)-N(7))-methyltransferase RsmG n=1 Tax=Parendozoicomonas sp. Alg238-R29 TaxID=2993446 RepID=UPI00248D528A|nr:16S rRNA (guanine(527)-N(7))-methyltransferase RsmG [Parendozoicomonas sp. Alg238-R29]
MNNLEVMLQSGADEMGIEISPEQIHALCEYVGLLVKWNKVYNLTAVRNPEDMISRHILDSLSILPFVKATVASGESFIDIGSGPGLPGIPLAIMLSDRRVSTLDCVGKKTRFQVQACTALGIENVTVLNERVENWKPAELYDVVMSRAFSSMKDMMVSTDHLLKADGKWLAMKGIHPEIELEELNTVRPDIKVTESHSLDVAGCEGQRHLVILERMETARA